ncbi:MAG TPA: transglutaminase domain-containing protein [Microbacteriaceae bacterium]|nr:transglutaminase domain-containing protein [Microbacteriaceae bacterium]
MTSRGPAFVVVNTVLALLATAAAAAAFWPIYRGTAFVAMVVVTLAVGAAIALCGAVFRWPSVVVAFTIVLSYFAFGVPLAIPSQAIGGVLPSWTGLRDLIGATALSWKELVTISVPVGSYQALLVPAFILTLLAIVSSLTIALRGKHGELAVVPPVLLLVAAILLGPSYPTDPVATALGLLVIVLFWLIWFRWQRRSASIRMLTQQSGVAVETPLERRFAGARTVLGAVVFIVVAGVAGTAASVVAPTHSARDVVRTRIEQPFDPRAYPSPLSGFRSYLEQGNSDRAMLTVTGLPADGRIRIATLDTYDGVIYSVGSGDVSSAAGSFTRLPYRLDQQGVQGTSASITVAIDGYSGVWVPGSGQLRSISFAGQDAALADSFFYNDTSGTAAVTRGLRSGDRYTLDTVVKPFRTAAQLATAAPGSAVLPKVAVVPAELDSTLQRYTASATTAGAKLEAALTGLATDGYLSHGIGPNEPVSRSGHGADRITQLLTDVPMVGDQEQYAVTAALMARQLGFPARVVMGFVAGTGTGTGTGTGAGSASGNAVTFTGSNISAWIEVQTRSDGWVTVDPTPPIRPVPPKQPQTPTQISRPQSVVPPPAADQQQQRVPAPQSHVDNTNPSTMSPLLAFLLGALMIIGWSLLALAILAAPFLAIIGAKWRRRVLRRRAPTSIERITGGWREFEDAVADHGYEPPLSATRSEVARTVGGTRSLALASVTDRAVFSPTAPTPAEAEAVWLAVGELRRSISSARTRRQRLAAMVSLRSLGVYRGRAAKQKAVKQKGGR